MHLLSAGLSALSSPGLLRCCWSIHSSTLFPQPQISLLLGLVGLVYTCSTFKCQHKQHLNDTYLRSPERTSLLCPHCTQFIPCHSKSVVSHVTSSRCRMSQFLSPMMYIFATTVDMRQLCNAYVYFNCKCKYAYFMHYQSVQVIK